MSNIYRMRKYECLLEVSFTVILFVQNATMPTNMFLHVKTLWQGKSPILLILITDHSILLFM